MIESSYLPGQVTCLLDPYRGETLSLEAKEARLREGGYYGDVLSHEDLPEAGYLAIFDRQNQAMAARLAPLVLGLAAKVQAARPGTEPLALASLARAGTPIGVVLAETLRRRHGREVTHYSVSIIHQYGLDPRALAYMLERHAPEALVFLDGWVSQGRITRTLQESLASRPDIDATVFCLSDPSGIQPSSACATREDLLLPSAVLNAAVSGLLSRTVYSREGFHACCHYAGHAGVDRTQAFITTLQEAVDACPEPAPACLRESAEQRVLASAQVARWCRQHQVTAGNAKIGLGEVSRGLLRRCPRLVEVDPSARLESEHLAWLAGQRGIALREVPLGGPFRAFSALE